MASWRGIKRGPLTEMRRGDMKKTDQDISFKCISEIPPAPPHWQERADNAPKPHNKRATPLSDRREGEFGFPRQKYGGIEAEITGGLEDF